MNGELEPEIIVDPVEMDVARRSVIGARFDELNAIVDFIGESEQRALDRVRMYAYVRRRKLAIIAMANRVAEPGKQE